MSEPHTRADDATSGEASSFLVVDECGSLSDDRNDALVAHLLEGRNTADFGQTGAAALMPLLFWGQLPAELLLGWTLGFALFAGLRATLRHRMVVPMEERRRKLLWLRLDVTAAAIGWAILVILISGTSQITVALMLICVAGLAAVATLTLVADRAAFEIFTLVLILPMAVSIAFDGLTPVHVSMLGLMTFFLPFMWYVHRRAHASLVDQIEANLQLRLREDEAKRRNDMLDALVSHTPNSFVVLDDTGRVMRANAAFERFLDLPIADIIARRVSELTTIDEEGQAVAQFMGSLQVGVTSDTELLFTLRDGNTRWLRLTGTRAGGHAAGLSIVSGLDVTEQVEARQEAEAARAQALEAARAKSSFLASMSHEIRTPMNGILGMLALLMDTELTAEQKDTAGVIQRSAEGLLGILNDILDVSKIEAGQLDLEEIDFDLAEVVTEVSRMFSPQAWAQSTEVAVDLGSCDRTWVRGDPVRVRQILNNLMSNAVKFTEGGEVVIGVEPKEGDRVKLFVRDTGMGIAPEKHAAVFAEFEQADQSTTRTHGGTGLGLAICQRLVGMMGGTLALESALGEGSTFSFEIPLPMAPERTEGRAQPLPNLGGKRFLVVDDNETARRIVREVLRREGATVDEAPGVESGLRLLHDASAGDRAYDVVVLDHLMPYQDGFDFARAVQNRPEVGGVPMLMLTSSGNAEDRTMARELGIGGHLAKPVARQDLIRAVSELLGHGTYDGPERRMVTETTLVQTDPMRILVAEDNKVNQHVARSLLAKQGHEVDIVENGQLALEAVLAKPYDLVLMDIQMPVMDGHEATRRIREMSHYASLPIVAVTAHAFAEERDRCQESGMDDFLAKPMKPAALYELLERWSLTSVHREGRGNGTFLSPGQGAESVDADGGGSDEPAEASNGQAGKNGANGTNGAGAPSGSGSAPAASHPKRRKSDRPAPGSAASGGDEPPVDIDGFRALMRSGGIEEIVEPTLDLYRQEAPGVVDQIREAWAAEDAEGICSAAHKLKSSSANIRADSFAALLFRLESAGREADLQRIAGLMPDIESEFDAVMAYLGDNVTA